MKVPEYTRQVSDGGPERVRRSPLDSGSAMSAVAAEGRGAQGVAGALGDLSGVFGKIAADADEAKIMAASNDYMAKSTSLLYDSEKGLLNAQGAGAEGLSERSAMAHKSFADDIASKLTARQRKHFYETVANYDRSAGRSVMAHESKALSDYRTGEAKKLLANTAVTFSKSPNELSMEAQEDLIRSITLGMFGDQGEEGNIKNSDLIRSALIQQTIANIAVNDPTAAEKFFEKHQSLMEASIAEEVKNTLVKAALPVKAQKLYTEVGGDFTKGIQYIQENVEPGQQKEYISAFKQEFTTQEAIKQDQRDKISDIVVEMSNTKTNYSQIKNYIKQNKALLGPKEFRTLNEFIDRDYERGKYTPKPVAPKRDSFHDLLMWTQAKEELVSGKYSSANEFLKAYKGVLPPGTLRSLANAAFYGKDPKTSAKDPYDRYNPLTTVGAMISDYQIDKDPREEQNFWAVFSDEAHVLETKNKRKLTAEEIEGIAKDLLKKTVLKKDYNNVEKIAMGLGIGKNWFEPDVTTEGYVYQEKAAYKNGIGYDVGTDTYYQIDEKGNITGWLPDSEPKLKAKDKRKIQGPGFYDE